MLASDEEGGSLDALRFSLASDIVELVVLTCDEAFLQTFREAVGGARRLWHVPSGDKVSDLLVAGEVGILVLDVHALSDADKLSLTTADRNFTIRTVACFGQCALAPVVEINHQILSHVTERTLEREVKALTQGRP